MRNVKLTQATLVGSIHHEAGAIVQMPNDLADAHIKAGMAEATTEALVDNPDANHLADAIRPKPPEGHAERALAEAGPDKVAQAPGLAELNRATNAGPPPGAPKRAGALTGEPKRVGKT